MPHNLYPPINIPAAAMTGTKWTFEHRTSSSLIPEQRIHQGHTNSTTILLRWRQAYYCAASYLDDLLGKLLDELQRLNLNRNTIVAFWSDHGFIMGEHGRWGKTAMFDRDLHTPMMVKIPGLTDGGVTVTQLTEFVDLFPTLVEAARLPPIPQCPVESQDVSTCHEGASMIPLIHNPLQNWKKAAFSQVYFPSDGLINADSSK